MAFVAALSGGTAGLIARIIIYPVETRRTVRSVHGAAGLSKLTLMQHYTVSRDRSLVYAVARFGLITLITGARRSLPRLGDLLWL